MRFQYGIYSRIEGPIVIGVLEEVLKKGVEKKISKTRSPIHKQDTRFFKKLFILQKRFHMLQSRMRVVEITTQVHVLLGQFVVISIMSYYCKLVRTVFDVPRTADP